MNIWSDLPLDGDMFYGYGDKYTISIHNLRVNGFDFDLSSYPIWNETYRQSLNLAILDWFDDYEIGFETPEKFKRALNAKMRLIMPKYNVMFKARNLTTQPLLDHDETVEHTEQGTLDTTQNIEESKTSQTVTDDDYRRDRDHTTDIDKTITLNRGDNETINEDNSQVTGETIGRTINTTEGKTSHDVNNNVKHDTHEGDEYRDIIDRFSDTPQQDIEHLGEAGEAPQPTPEQQQDSLFNPVWIDHWLTNAELNNMRDKDKDNDWHTSDTEDNYTHNVNTNTTDNISKNKNVTEDNAKTRAYTRADSEHDVTNEQFDENIQDARDTTQDYTHGITNDKVIDTDTTKHYIDHLSGRKYSEQELAQKLYETAYDIELLIIADLQPLFMSLYDF